jgi:hypothetical protein
MGHRREGRCPASSAGALRRDGHRDELWSAVLLWDGFAVCLKPGDVRFDRLHCPLLALLNRLSVREAARQRRNSDEVALVRFGHYSDRVGTHALIVSQVSSQLVNGSLADRDSECSFREFRYLRYQSVAVPVNG